ncbi:Hypothetical protein SRAE_X000026300 [Strongyloides ratti]|uniref:Transthyretin-like family-containing protein n=1 Tax=Strongyloides ratti TaxID=34506 RepID=A0A090N0M2_STRRB|nr:Hypothetical protein SRAE_X000026300 [Strongyloides ratti]CEF70933.1 Hypothetical protein SRAE_X000026300 [Strongyloides ratti]
MHSSKSYLFNILITIAIIFVVSNCQNEETDTKEIQTVDKWFVGNVEVTCNGQHQENVNVSIFKLVHNDEHNSLYNYIVLNSSLTDSRGLGQVTGHWTIPPNYPSCRMCLFHNCKPKTDQIGAKMGEYVYSYCFSFGQSYIKNSLEQAQNNDFNADIELTLQSSADWVATIQKTFSDCPPKGKTK